MKMTDAEVKAVRENADRLVYMSGEVRNSADSLLSSRHGGTISGDPDAELAQNLALLAKELSKWDVGAAPGPALLPAKLTPADRIVRDDATALAADPKWMGKPAVALRKVLAILAKYVV